MGPWSYRTPDRPLTDFGQLWTDRRECCVVVVALWIESAGLLAWCLHALAIPSSKVVRGN